MSDLPTGKGGGPSPFVNAFDHPQLNSLRYNTSHAGSPLHLVFGTQRVTVNLLEFWGFSGSAYVTGTPLQLGSSPALPNLSFEIYGIEAGTAGPSYPRVALPDPAVT